jgi:SAM-dependent methyltransferase
MARMRFQGIPNVTTAAELEAHILARGCFDATENARIYKKWFTGSRPRDEVFAYVDRLIHLTDKTIADVGCNYGMTLVQCRPGSFGLELDELEAKFGRSIGLDVRTRNVLTDDLSDLPKVDVVWCAATLEHVDAPHVFLRRLYTLLKPAGELVIEVPCALPAKWMRRLPGATRIYGDHDDHVNSFSPTSLARFCERAGFAEQALFRYSTPLVRRQVPVWAARIPPLSLLAQSIIYIGRQIPEWDYPPRASRRVAENRLGYTYRERTGRGRED